MKQEELKQLTEEKLIEKEKSTKTLIGIFIPIIIGLFYFIIRDYIKEQDLDMAIVTIAICSIGGMISLFPELKKIREEIDSRK